MSRRQFAQYLAAFCLIAALSLSQGCYCHHDTVGYHRDFAWYTPEHVSAGRRHDCDN